MGTKMCRISARTTLVFTPKVDILDFWVLFLKKVFPKIGKLATLGPRGLLGPLGAPGPPRGSPGPPRGPRGSLGPLGPWPCGPVRGGREAIYTCLLVHNLLCTSWLGPDPAHAV